MNRSGSGDSRQSLDAGFGLSDCACHDRAALSPLSERRDAGGNMARFYTLSVEETLFGQPCLVRRWAGSERPAAWSSIVSMRKTKRSTCSWNSCGPRGGAVIALDFPFDMSKRDRLVEVATAMS